MPADLDHDVGTGEKERAVAEGPGYRDRQDEAGEREPDEDEADDDRLEVELVRDPGRVVPSPPDDEQRKSRVPRPLPAQVVEQEMRDLRDREDEDEVEEELEARRALLAAVALAEVAAVHAFSATA